MTLEEAIAEALAIPEAPAASVQPGCPGDVKAPPLSRREREVAALVAQGCTNSQIAAELALAVRTIDGHVFRILRKLGVASRTEVAARLPREHPTSVVAP